MAGSDSPSAAARPTVVSVVIKNPANASVVDFSLAEVPLWWSVGDLKRRICAEYDGNPPPASQRLIFAGSLLKDEKATIVDVLRSADLTAPQIFHMVVSQNPNGRVLW